MTDICKRFSNGQVSIRRVLNIVLKMYLSSNNTLTYTNNCMHLFMINLDILDYL